MLNQKVTTIEVVVKSTTMEDGRNKQNNDDPCYGNYNLHPLLKNLKAKLTYESSRRAG